MKTVKLKQKEERRILRGHPWVFSNEIESAADTFIPGELTEVLDSSAALWDADTLIPIR